MLVLALQFSRSARHDVEAKDIDVMSSACHTSQQRRPTIAGRHLLGVEGNSLKTEEKTMSRA